MSLRSQATCNEFFPNGACNVSSSGDPEWEIPRARLNVEKVIGRGEFGVVSRGLAFDLPGKPGWTVVAVKSVQGYISLYFPLKKRPFVHLEKRLIQEIHVHLKPSSFDPSNVVNI